MDINKYKFYIQKTKYLGLIITPRGVEIDPNKIVAVKIQEAPILKKQFQRFLKFTNFYRRFIVKFSYMAKLFYELIKKQIDQYWNDKY